VALLQASGSCRTGQPLLLLRQPARLSRALRQGGVSHAGTKCKVGVVK
jgi:hypothetical protein